MLVLTRRCGESLMIGDDIEIRILEVKGDLVKVGIAAPRTMPVHRQEVYEEIKQANHDAARFCQNLASLELPLDMKQEQNND
jgi:carbon storage regulator